MEYDDSFLEEISEKVDLLEYASNDFQFIKKNQDYFTNCPLHSDFTPSLSITPEKNVFYCHSCGIGGGLIGWLMHIEGMSFDKAVEKASKLANIELSAMCQSKTVKLLRRIRKLKTASKHKQHVFLKEAEFDKYRIGKVNEWLNEGIRQSEIDLFEIRLDDRSNQLYTLLEI